MSKLLVTCPRQDMRCARHPIQLSLVFSTLDVCVVRLALIYMVQVMVLGSNMLHASLGVVYCTEKVQEFRCAQRQECSAFSK
jgi:hypothetical protein